MGQKTNPNIFRLGKTISWKSKYLENKPQEFAIYSFQDMEIRKFINKFFKNSGLIVHNCKLSYLDNNSFHIFISYYVTVQSVSFIESVNKDQKIRFWRVKNNRVRPKKWKRRNRVLIGNIENLVRYRNFSYYTRLKKNLSKDDLRRVINNVHVDNNTKKIRRLILLKCYKRYLALKKYKKIKEVYDNSFLENFFESLHLFLNGNTKIFLTLQQLNKELSKSVELTKRKAKTLKKILVKLKRYKQNEFFKEGIGNLFSTILYPNSASLMAKFITSQLQKQKRHNFFLRFLKTAASILIKSKFSNINGIKLKITGRLNGARRARRRIIQIGSGVPVLSLNSNIDYSEDTAFTSNGTIGVKVWIYSKS